jgi:ketosteroid isomerase-like protein
VAVSALQLGQEMIAGWNEDRLETVFATFDQDIVVRTDPSWPERIWFGRASAERFWHDVRDAMGPDPFEVEEEHDLGDRALWRLRQRVSSPSGVQSAYSWSFLITSRCGRVIMVEFFIDDAALLAELGISASRAQLESADGPG